MNQLSTADRTRVLACLVEGNSQRATCRMTGIAKGTVAKLAVEIGRAVASEPPLLRVPHRQRVRRRFHRLKQPTVCSRPPAPKTKLT